MEIRLRLQALEQNTVPPAAQKPREWLLLHQKFIDRADCVLMDGLDAKAAAQLLGNGYVRVREVLD